MDSLQTLLEVGHYIVVPAGLYAARQFRKNLHAEIDRTIEKRIATHEQMCDHVILARLETIEAILCKRVARKGSR